IKEEQWWLVLGNTSTSELYALKRVSFSDHLVTTMKLPPTAANLQGENRVSAICIPSLRPNIRNMHGNEMQY
ncbi:activating signal cointegrator 1 complex subunit 3, partial [Trifolium medium]|nr:activating signal cointegrator 1 complex subunit 3 [Trifolium medium]